MLFRSAASLKGKGRNATSWGHGRRAGPQEARGQERGDGVTPSGPLATSQPRGGPRHPQAAGQAGPGREDGPRTGLALGSGCARGGLGGGAARGQPEVTPGGRRPGSEGAVPPGPPARHSAGLWASWGSRGFRTAGHRFRVQPSARQVLIQPGGSGGRGAGGGSRGRRSSAPRWRPQSRLLAPT